MNLLIFPPDDLGHPPAYSLGMNPREEITSLPPNLRDWVGKALVLLKEKEVTIVKHNQRKILFKYCGRYYYYDHIKYFFENRVEVEFVPTVLDLMDWFLYLRFSSHPHGRILDAGCVCIDCGSTYVPTSQLLCINKSCPSHEKLEWIYGESPHLNPAIEWVNHKLLEGSSR